MTMNTFSHGLGLSTLLLAALAGCASSSSGGASPAKSTRLGRQVLPLPPDWLLSFTSGGGEVLRRDTQASERKLAAAPTGFGRPIASSVDLGSLMAAVVHEHGFAVVNLSSSETEPSWLPKEWSKPPTSVFVSDVYAATLGGSEACFWDLSSAKLTLTIDLASWSRDHRLGPAVCIVPDRSIQGRATVLFSSPERTDLQVLDFSRGTPEVVASASILLENTKKSWWRVERCAYDGERLFLSGTQEVTGTNSSGQVVPQPSPFLMKVDLETRVYELLFRENTHALDQEVDELAAANGMVATLRRDGLLRVFRDREKVYEKQDRPGRALAWLGENSLAIFDASAIETIAIPGTR
ncbi:MAG TPA: hypothetical protein VK843_08720 [Planctomycetota bacterium]|nr:hypothetical protein [Planctomycetota bacterium]